MKKNTLESFVRPDVLAYKEYQPVPSAYEMSITANLPINEIAKLDAGENVYGPSPKVIEALANFRGYQFYPDAHYTLLRKKLSEYTGIAADSIGVGAGGDEIIDLLMRLLLEPGDEIIDTPPTFSTYSLSASLNHGVITKVPRLKNYDLDIKGMIAAITDKTKIIIVCNPNNPTGTLTPQKDIIKLLKTGVPVLVDEAYYEYADTTMASYLKQYPNLLVLRSLSKWAGIAGLRLGYLLADPYIVRQMNKIKAPYNVTVATELAGIAALEDQEYAAHMISSLKQGRDHLITELKKNKKFKVLPSSGNFVFVKMDEPTVKRVKKALSESHIAVRYYNSPLTGTGIRITVGKQHQNAQIITILSDL